MDNGHTPRAEAGTPEFFLEVAERIGGRVARQAEWEGDGCTWTIMSPDRDEPASRVAKASAASGTLYEGTAGVGLFLAELHAATGGRDPEVRRAAEGALRFALADGERLPEGSFGFHGGRVGIAYAAARGAHLLGVDDLRAKAEELLKVMVGKESTDRGLDVIAGAGGAIPALLRMTEWGVDEELAVGIARRLGDTLLETAERESGGWAWGTMRGSSIRHLCGYAHGSAGVGHGLLELYRHTGDAAYLYGMEQAFLYERRFFSAEASNWPDLRHSELGDYLYQNRTEELKERLRAGNFLAPQPPRYMSAWCHGAPGIGLSRLRAWQVLGDPVYLEEANAAIVGTRQSLVDPRMNYSLCHGQGGNAETLVYGAEVLDDPALRAEAGAVAVRGWEDYEREGKAWPCGTLGGVLDPGLLLGESGIGYFMLRLARPETPSVVFVTSGGAELDAPRSDDGYQAWRQRVVDEHLGRTLRAFEALGEPVDRLNPARAPGAAPERSDVEIVHDNVAEHVVATTDPARRE
ncbi:MAG TPA: lanthionine synthetase LanC family protein, partial [Longimicrobium sp.]|nr:lanthionine synthetase LanC family protein [Longimicrobium sp.]